MPRLTSLPRPFIVGVITERTPREAFESIAAAQRDGADAVELNLPAIGEIADEEFRLLESVGTTIYTSCRRREFMAVYGLVPQTCPDWTEQERMEQQLRLISVGSVALDMELDTFDPTPAPPLRTPEAVEFAATAGDPMEVSHLASAVARQREVVDLAHERGGEVIISCHTGRRQTARQLVDIVETAEGRGADLVKVVTPCLDRSDVGELYAGGALLKQVAIPFALIGAGEAGAESRSPRAPIPSAWHIGRPSVQSNSFDGQPPVSFLSGERSGRKRTETSDWLGRR